MNIIGIDPGVTGAIEITVYGTPGPQGSKRHVGKGIMIESSKKVAPWREAVKHATMQARTGPPLDGPLIVRMVFTFARPQSHYRSGRNSHLLRDDAPLAPCGKPDVSKLARSTEDALTDIGAWKDDARVVEYERLAKVYCPGTDPEALAMPGVRISIRVMRR